MKNEERFARIFQTHGMPWSDNSSSLEGVLPRHFFSSYFRGFDPLIYVGIVSNNTFNAVATRHALGEFVALYQGALTQLTAYAYQFFADPTTYPQVGDSAREPFDPRFIRIFSDGLADTIEQPLAPSCPVRLAAASRIAEIACLTLCSHEIAHLQGCHLDLIRDQLSITEHSELSVLPLTEQEALLLRTLELEADGVGLVNSLSVWRKMWDMNSGFSELGQFGPTKSWVLSTELLFWVMSFNNTRIRSGQLASHPHPLTRYINMRMIRGLNGQIDNDLVDAIDNNENVFLRWIVNTRPSNEMTATGREIIAEELSELKANLKHLWPRLDPLIESRRRRLENRPND